MTIFSLNLVIPLKSIMNIFLLKQGKPWTCLFSVTLKKREKIWPLPSFHWIVRFLWKVTWIFPFKNERRSDHDHLFVESWYPFGKISWKFPFKNEGRPEHVPLVLYRHVRSLWWLYRPVAQYALPTNQRVMDTAHINPVHPPSSATWKPGCPAINWAWWRQMGRPWWQRNSPSGTQSCLHHGTE